MIFREVVMDNRAGFFSVILRLFICFLILLPNYVLAAAGVPGIYSPRIAGPVPNFPNKGGPVVTIPGIYRGRAISSPQRSTRPTNADVKKMVGIQQIDDSSSPNTTTIYQINEEKAIIDWKKFDIGADATVEFKQGTGTKDNLIPKSNYSVLNRIWDREPSYIFGKLTADGKIYLINQNGILFGPGSKVDVGSLTASALNIDDNDFINGVFKFKHENYRIADDTDAVIDSAALVSNHGEITVMDGGSVLLFGPLTENAGLIDASTGQIGLAAGTDIELVNKGSRSAYYILVKKTGAGNSINQAGGRLHADGGLVGMYGDTVDNWGVIRSMTAFKNNRGEVELRAAGKVTTGENSLIDLPVNPSTTETISDTFDIQPRVSIKGLDGRTRAGEIGSTSVRRIELRGEVTAPTGNVELKADERIYLTAGSRIDVSGVIAELPPSLVRSFKLTSVELRDAYGQKSGIIPGMKIATPVTAGSAIGDLSQVYLTQDRTAMERSIGGAVTKDYEANTYEFQTGFIDMIVTDGDIILKEGSVLDFSGGAAHYSSGFVNSTKLVSGKKIYDIRNAPLYLNYDKVLGQFEKAYDRFGVREKYSGMYYGGASPLRTNVRGYTKGGDAGTLQLRAASIVLDGQLDGSVMRSAYQNTVTENTLSEEFAISVARGLEVPKAGTLIIGYDGLNDFDNSLSGLTSSVFINSEALPRIDISPDSELLRGEPTEISANILNEAQLGTLELNVLETITIDPEVAVSLQPGGAFESHARRIEHYGDISVPSGKISMFIEQNVTSFADSVGNENKNYKDLLKPERIILGSGSLLDVSGQRIDNTPAGRMRTDVPRSGRTDGGAIELIDNTDLGDGVFMQKGAVVNVSSGYTLDPEGMVTGGNAGAVTVQGSNIMLEGDLRGYALADVSGKLSGGSITLQTRDIRVAVAGNDWSGFDAVSDILNVNDSRNGMLVIAGDRFEDTGFTQIALKSFSDIIIEPDVRVSTSLVRLNSPKPALHMQKASTNSLQYVSGVGSVIPGRPDLLRLDDSMAYMAGASSFRGTAGSNFQQADSDFQGNLKEHITGDRTVITVSEGSTVSTAPGGTITFSGSSDAKTAITVAGTLNSPGGVIDLSSNNAALIIKSTAALLAKGYNRPEPSTTPPGFELNYQPVKGGRIILSGKVEDSEVILESGSLIDISGSDVVENKMRTADGGLVTFPESGDPGSLVLNFFSNLEWNGTVNARANMTGIRGASLTINRTDMDNPLIVSAENIMRAKDLGFDDLTLKSLNSIQFSGSVNAAFGRKLTLDAPVIEGSGNNRVTLQAPWITVANSYYPTSASSNEGTGQFTLSGAQWIDVIGSIQFIGFEDVSLEASRDIRLSQANYRQVPGHNTEVTDTASTLFIEGNLNLKADRIYPDIFYDYRTTNDLFYPNIYSDYTLHANGKVTILPADTRIGGPIYSAGGNLKIEAGTGIEHRGTLAAPLGTITLTTATIKSDPNIPDSPLITEPGSRIYLAEGSLLTTVGNTDVLYNAINSNNIWVTEDKRNPGAYDSVGQADSTTTLPFDQSRLPKKSVALIADETIIGEKSKIAVSGGGSFFSYKFLLGIEGTNNPIEKSGRYIVFQNDGFQMPEAAVYLEGGGGLDEGMYTFIPLGEGNLQNARYAFMPGAYVLELQSDASLPGQNSMSKFGYPLVVGYTAVANTSIIGTRPKVYTVRTASDIMTEGHFDKQTLVAGDAGDLMVKGNTTIIDGNLSAAALNETYRGSKIELSAQNVIVQRSAASNLPAAFGFTTGIDADIKNKLIVSDSSLSGKGFREIRLGDDATHSVTVKEGVNLEAAEIALTANKTLTDTETGQQKAPSIIIGTSESGAVLYAKTDKGKDSGEGVIELTTPGSLSVKSGSILHASHNITFVVDNVEDIQGDLQIDNSSLTLKSTAIYFTEDSKKTSDVGLYLNSKLLETFNQFEDMTFIAGYTDTSKSNSDDMYVATDIWFEDSYDLIAEKSITLDAARIIGDAEVSVSLTAPTVTLTNSGDRVDASLSSVTDVTETETGTFFMANASEQITVGGGNLLFGGFDTILLKSSGDVTFKGKGTLSTGNADLDIMASRVTTSADSIADGAYQAPDFRIIAGSGQNDLNPAYRISMMSPGGNQAGPEPSSVYGGMFEVAARKIEVGTVLQVGGGDIKLTTKGAQDVDGAFLPLREDAEGSFSDGIVLKDGAKIIAQGTDDAPGGRVRLATSFIDENGQEQSGKIKLQEGSLIDVSAGAQGDAGFVTILAPTGGAFINGVLQGQAGVTENGSRGRGGSLVLEADSVELSSLNRNLKTGGFDQSIDIRARRGDLVITPSMTNSYDPQTEKYKDNSFKAQIIKLTSDNGKIDVYGAIDASAYYNDANGHEDTYYSDGGLVELYAESEIFIHDTGEILSSGANGGDGGDVLLSSAKGLVNISANAVNVSGARGGTVYLRAQRDGNDDVKIDMNDSIMGASAIYLEPFKTYTYNSSLNIETSNKNLWLNEAETYYNTNKAVTRLSGAVPDYTGFYLLPGIELVSTDDINLNTMWDLSGIRFGSVGEPGVLTLRAGRNLNIYANLVDHPTSMANLTGSTARDSWGLNLAAGADTTGADPLAVVRERGDLIIADQKAVYTESAPIRFASGNDTVIGRGQDSALGYMVDPTMIYNLASYDGSIQGNIGRDLVINGGAIQAASGDINLNVGQDIQLNTARLSVTSSGKKYQIDAIGAIRTTGVFYTADIPDPAGDPYTSPSRGSRITNKKNYFWRYAGGGDISLNVGRYAGTYGSRGWTTITSASAAWDNFTSILKEGGSTRKVTDFYGWFSARYKRGLDFNLNSKQKLYDTTSGFATMGGGNLSVRTGADFLSQAGTFGKGDLSIYAGGNINGRFLSRDGEGHINAMGNFGSSDAPQQVELFDSRMSITSAGDMQIGAVLNPSLASDQLNQKYWINNTYTVDTNISMKAGGDITITGTSPWYSEDIAKKAKYAKILPAQVDIEAGGDIILLSDDLTLTSSPTGNLRLAAGRDIVQKVRTGNNPSDRAAGIMMSDIAPEYWYDLVQVSQSLQSDGGDKWNTDRTLYNRHGFFKPEDSVRQAQASSLHTGDMQAVEITAGRDIRNLGLYTAKKTEVQAGQDILAMTYEGQNVHKSDVSKLVAGRDILMQYEKKTTTGGLVQGGPGVFIVQAGNSIDLGTSNNELVNQTLIYGGLQTIGNGNNVLLGTEKSTLAVLSGYDRDISSKEIKTFFDDMRDTGDQYAELTSKGKLNEAAVLLQATRDKTVKSVLGAPSGKGDINMIASQVGTSIGESDIFIIAGGSMNLGKTSLPIAGEESGDFTGIWTGGGGSINIFTRKDVNVNESRIMTFFGGDITIWSDEGSINAGRGSRTAVSAAPARLQEDPPLSGIYRKVFSPPVIGSGIRAVTYDPDGSGPITPPEPGDIHLTAPSGIIDAGEAGITGGQVILAALEVKNAANISFSAGSVGVPQAAAAGTTLGSLSGGSLVAQNSQLSGSDTAAVAAERTAQATKMIEDILMKWLDVDVIGFIQDEGEEKERGQEE